MPRRRSAIVDQLESTLRQGYYGTLAWEDQPSGPGYFWYRVGPSTVIRGPAHVFEFTEGYTMISEGRRLDPGLYTGDGEGRWKRCDTFARRWSGPIDRPVEPI